MWTRLTVVVGLVASAACDPPPPPELRFAVDPDAVRYAAWQDGDGAWQPIDAEFQVATEGRYGVALQCEGDPRLYVYFGTSVVDPVGAGIVSEFGCTSRAWIPFPLWFDEPTPLDRTCAVASPSPSCPTLIPAAVTVIGAGGDPITIVSATPTQIVFESATEARLVEPDLAGGRQTVTVEARGAQHRVIEQRVPGGLPFALAPFELPPPVALEATRDGFTWDREFTSVRAALRAPSLTAHQIVVASWVDAGGGRGMPIVDPSALPGFDAASLIHAGETVAWTVDLDLDADRRVTADGTLTW